MLRPPYSPVNLLLVKPMRGRARGWALAFFSALVNRRSNAKMRSSVASEVRFEVFGVWLLELRVQVLCLLLLVVGRSSGGYFSWSTTDHASDYPMVQSAITLIRCVCV